MDTSVLYALFGDYIFARSTQCSNLPVSPQMFYKVNQFLLSSYDGQQRQIQMLLDRNLVFLFFFCICQDSDTEDWSEWSIMSNNWF